MCKLNLLYLDVDKIYVCSKCNTHLSAKNELISKNFYGHYWTAYLFNKVIIIKKWIL